MSYFSVAALEKLQNSYFKFLILEVLIPHLEEHIPPWQVSQDLWQAPWLADLSDLSDSSSLEFAGVLGFGGRSNQVMK